MSAEPKAADGVREPPRFTYFYDRTCGCMVLSGVDTPEDGREDFVRAVDYDDELAAHERTRDALAELESLRSELAALKAQPDGLNIPPSRIRGVARSTIDPSILEITFADRPTDGEVINTWLHLKHFTPVLNRPAGWEPIEKKEEFHER